MNIWLAVILTAAVLIAALCTAAEPVAPTRIDGGVLVPTTESIKKLITACVPIRIVVSFVVLEDGTTADLKVVEAVPDGVDVSVATEAVKRFQYQPIIVDGVAVKSALQRQETIYDPVDDPNCDTIEDTGNPLNDRQVNPGEQ